MVQPSGTSNVNGGPAEAGDIDPILSSGERDRPGPDLDRWLDLETRARVDP